MGVPCVKLKSKLLPGMLHSEPPLPAKSHLLELFWLGNQFPEILYPLPTLSPLRLCLPTARSLARSSVKMAASKDFEFL